MTNLDHNRPILKLLDAMRRERQRLAAPPLIVGKIGKAIKRAIPVGARRDREIVHETAVAVLTHYGKNHDRRPLELLLEAVEDERSKAALTRWLCVHGPLTVDDSGTFKFVKGGRTLIGPASLDPYWKYYPKKVAAVFDPIAELERMERRIVKAGGHPQLLSGLRSLIKVHRT